MSVSLCDLASAPSGFTSQAVYTSSGTFNAAGLGLVEGHVIYAILVGGGQSGFAESGGLATRVGYGGEGGRVFCGYDTLGAGVTTLTVTIGAGGAPASTGDISGAAGAYGSAGPNNGGASTVTGAGVSLNSNSSPQRGVGARGFQNSSSTSRAAGHGPSNVGGFSMGGGNGNGGFSILNGTGNGGTGVGRGSGVATSGAGSSGCVIIYY